MVERGYEGFVAKDDASPYEPGPTRRWLKVKQKGWTVDEDRWRRRISLAGLLADRRHAAHRERCRAALRSRP